jgi:alkanesulfonate monooxygenase SsuD/methylene tetrahydromethanopterin reductase-like flavin-dependent oxidoreductase (luciferase family)
METEIGLASPAAFRSFTEELASAVATLAAKYDSSASKSRRFRVVLGSHPSVTKSDADAAAETAAHRRRRKPKPRRNNARRL